jgi:DedD protein
MDPQLKRRLVGTVIIVSLVVIFVPMLFEEKDDLNQDSRETSIPEFPQDFDSQVIPLPTTVPEVTNPSGADLDAQSAGQSPSRKDVASQPAKEPTAEPGEKPSVPSPARRNDALDPLLNVPADKTSGAADSADEEDFPAQPAKIAVTPVKPATTHATPDAKAAPKPLAETVAKPVSEAAPAVQTPPKETPASAPVSKPAKRKTVTTTATPKSPIPDKSVPATPQIPAAKPAPAPASAVPAPEATGAAAAPKELVSLSAWMIQAGSFNDEANARNLMSRLRQAKIPAFVEKVPGANDSVSYRVRVGPELERAKAEQTLKRMESDAGVKGMIVSYP